MSTATNEKAHFLLTTMCDVNTAPSKPYGDIESWGEKAPILNDESDSSFSYQATTNNDMHDLNASFTSDSYVNYFESNRGVFFAFLNLLVYFVLAVFAYSYWFEHWTVIDSLYFAVCTFTTVGFGDLFPSSDACRLFTIFFAIYGIFILGFFVGLVGEKIVELHNQALQSVQDRATSRATSIFTSNRNDENLRPLPTTQKSVYRLIAETIALETPIIAGILAVAIAIGHFQGWSIISSIYFGIVTSTTVGFGDLSITGQLSRAVCIIALPLMVAVFCEVLSRIAGAYLKYKMEQEEIKFLNRQLSLQDLIHMDTDHDGEVIWAEFLEFMLLAMQKVDAEDIAQLREIFDKLDTSGDGVLTKEDLEIPIT